MPFCGGSLCSEPRTTSRPPLNKRTEPAQRDEEALRCLAPSVGIRNHEPTCASEVLFVDGSQTT